MPSDDHPILEKLATQVLPWIVVGARADRQWFIWANMIHSYGRDIFTALAGVGIGAPVITLFSKQAEGKNGWQTMREALPQPWLEIGVVALVIWIVLSVVVKNQGAMARSIHARECAIAMKQLYSKLEKSLSEPRPMSMINQVKDKAFGLQETARAKDAWPDVTAPWPKPVEVDLQRRIGHIRESYMRNWESP